MKMSLRAPLAARYARLSPEDKDQNPENQALKASHARAWSFDRPSVTMSNYIATMPTYIGTTPKDIAYLLRDFTGRTAFCAVMQTVNRRREVNSFMMNANKSLMLSVTRLNKYRLGMSSKFGVIFSNIKSGGWC